MLLEAGCVSTCIVKGNGGGTPLKLTSTCRHTLSMVLMANGRISQIPALFTNTLFFISPCLSSTMSKWTHSIGPNSFSIASNTVLQFSRSATLHSYALTCTPSFSHAAFVKSCFSTLRSRRARVAPLRARERAIAAPIPAQIKRVTN